jgi:hypothetical protein
MRIHPDTCILQIDETGTLGRITYYSNVIGKKLSNLAGPLKYPNCKLNNYSKWVKLGCFLFDYFFWGVLHQAVSKM